MSLSSTPTPTPPACHPLVALDLVTRAPTLDTPLLQIIPHIPGLKKRLRAKRKPSDATLRKRAEVAVGRSASGITYHPDGSRTVEFRESADREATGNGHDKHQEENPWHTI